MTFHFNTQLIIVCVFYFFLSIFIAHMIKGFGFILKTIFLIIVFSILNDAKGVTADYKTEVFISCAVAFLYVFTDSIVDFFSAMNRWIQNVFYGISYRARLIALLIGKILYAVRWVLRLVLIPIANLFTWFYNLLSRTFRWNRVFIPLTEQFKRKRREGESRRSKHESRQSGAGNHQKAGSTNSEQEEYIRRAKEKVRQAREEAERKKREEEQGNSGGDQRTPRQILGLSDTFTLEELKKAYKQAAFRYHPDKYAHMSETFQKEAQAEFVKAKNAYDVLMKGFR
jgi:hypothetical protein